MPRLFHRVDYALVRDADPYAAIEVFTAPILRAMWAQAADDAAAVDAMEAGSSTVPAALAAPKELT